MQPRVEILCEGNNQIGFGHIRRSLALANQLNKYGIITIVTGLSDETQIHLPKYTNKSLCPKVQIFDGISGVNEKILRAQQRGQITVALDWFGEAVPDVNIAVYPHKKVKALKKTFIGFEYIIIRDEIKKKQVSRFPLKNNSVLICIGGADVLNQGEEVAEIISQLGMEVTLIQGPLATKIKKTKKYQTIHDPDNFTELMQSSNWLVTNGGGCMFEAMYLKKPVFSLPQTQAEMNISRIAFESGALLGIGLDSLRIIKKSKLQAVSQIASKLIDGKGVERISGIINDLLFCNDVSLRMKTNV